MPWDLAISLFTACSSVSQTKQLTVSVLCLLSGLEVLSLLSALYEIKKLSLCSNQTASYSIVSNHNYLSKIQRMSFHKTVLNLWDFVTLSFYFSFSVCSVCKTLATLTSFLQLKHLTFTPPVGIVPIVKTPGFFGLIKWFDTRCR